MRPSPRSRTLRAGFVALFKCVVLVLGVPFAILRLWRFSAQQSYPAHLDVFITGLLLLTLLTWCYAVLQLFKEIHKNLHEPETPMQSSWSSSWAAGLVGLLLLIGALSSHAGSSTPIVTSTSTPIHNAQIATSTTSIDAHARAAEELITGLGLVVAGGLARRLQLLSRLRRSLRVTGTTTVPPAQELQSIVRSLQQQDQRALDWIEAVNRLLGSISANSAPEVALIRIGGSGIEVLLQRSREQAPYPFHSAAGGWWWILDNTVTMEQLRELTHGSRRSVPGLVPVGSDGVGEILIALGPGRVLSIDGGEEETDATLSALMIGLRVLPWYDELAVELIGVEPPPLSERSMNLQRSNLATLESIIERPTINRRDMEGTWRREPFVVVNRATAERPEAERLRSIAEALGGIVADGAGSLVLRLNGDSATLEPFHISVTAPAVETTLQASVDRLLTCYAQPYEHVSLLDQEPERICVEKECEVHMLGGAIEISDLHDLPDPSDLERVKELIIFLAFHDYSANSQQLLGEMMSKGKEHTEQRRLENLIAITRAALGRSSLGIDKLRVDKSGTVILDRSVALDWQELRENFFQSSRLAPAPAMELLQRSLSSIDAEHLLEVVDEYPWFCALRLGDVIRAAIVDATHHLTVLALGSGDFEVAQFSLNIGLEIEPASEDLVRDRMVLGDLRGSHDEVEQIYIDHQAMLDDLGGAEPSRVTRRLFSAINSSSSNDND